MNQDLKKSLKSAVSNVLKTAYDVNEQHIKDHLSDSQFRKVRKLANNPELFVKDVVEKRKNQARKYIPIKYSGKFNYTVVSAVYNVEKYLDEYFESLVNQSLNFKKHIHLILVDDGSTDNSANIIKKWQKKYPKNIHYYYKENGGQASARNLGLQYVETEWVTFIDSDDKVHLDYFKIIDDVLANQQNIGLAVGNLHYYYDEDKSIKDTHPLKYRFEKSLSVVPVKELDKNINLFVTVSFFKADVLHKNNIIFDDKIKPNFEDGKFLADYFLFNDTQNIAYVKDAIFYYRKRGDGSSTIDTAWTKKEKYINVLKYGHLTMLEQYHRKYGVVPKNIQNTVLYDFFWYIDRLLNKPEKLEFLGDDLKQQFYDLSRKIFSYIDEDVILSFNAIPRLWFFYKVGILGLFKQSSPKFQICYIENHDSAKNQVLIVSFSHYDAPVSYELEGVDIIPKFYKEIIHTLNEQTFVREYRAWISYNPQYIDQKIKVFINNEPARISLKNQAHKTEFLIENIIQAFKPKPEYQQDGSWLLMDRETKADDNAEHFYRYLKKNHPEQNCYFVLSKNSQDWQRLENDGFNLVEFGGLDYELHLKKANAIISSHLEQPINNYFNDNYDYSKRFVFLQHGVTKDNLSGWVNTKKNIDLFVTSTIDEQQSIVSKNSPYRLFSKEVKLLGFSRHDDLLLNNLNLEKRILIMPTWRSYIVGKSIGLGVNTRKINDNFMNTSYALSWSNLLVSNELYELVSKYNYEIIFAPHPNIEPYLEKFNIPSYIKCLALSEFKDSIQSLFQNSSILITDYSSVAFEMAYIGKTTLYYQFDQKEFFSGEHTYQKGYFDYEQHGFGAVVETESDLLMALEQVLQNNGEPVEPYATRIRETFPFRDGKCCERVYQAILDLDKPDDGSVDLEILADMVKSAKAHRAWHLVESRCQKQLEIAPLNATERHQSEQAICQAMYMQGKYAELVNFLETTSLNDDEKAYWQIKLDLWLQKYDEVCNYFEKYGAINNQDKLLVLLAYAYTQNESAFIEVLDDIDIESLSQAETQLLKIAELIFEQDHQALSELLIELLSDDEMIAWTKDELQIYKPQLILAKALIAQEDYKLCHHYLNRYKEQVADDYACRLIFAQMDFAKGGYKWSVVHYEYLLDIPVKLNQADYAQYLIALCQENQIDKLADIDTEILLNNERLLKAWVELQIQHQEWQKLNELFVQNPTLQQSMIYEYVLSQVRMGKYDGLDKVLPKPAYGNTYEYWRLAFDIATINDNIELQKYCHKGIIAIFSNHEHNNIFGVI